jgi:Transposase IS116/IS110/IS902 family
LCRQFRLTGACTSKIRSAAGWNGIACRSDALNKLFKRSIPCFLRTKKLDSARIANEIRFVVFVCALVCSLFPHNKHGRNCIEKYSITLTLQKRAAPEKIAGLARGSAKRKIPQLIEAIEGNRMSDHVRFLIRGCLRHLACLEEEVEELDTEILRRMQLSTFQKAFTLLQTIPGVGQLSAATILAETGPDLDSFPTAEQMASWAGLCPGNRESAGIQKGPQTTLRRLTLAGY